MSTHNNPVQLEWHDMRFVDPPPLIGGPPDLLCVVEYAAIEDGRRIYGNSPETVERRLSAAPRQRKLEVNGWLQNEDSVWHFCAKTDSTLEFWSRVTHWAYMQKPEYELPEPWKE